MLRTLHGYLGRELAKAFFLTGAALTMMMVMGGAVANLFRSQGIDAKSLGWGFAYFTPVAVTIMLPIAALFAAAITYGRSSADNEMTACRAAGINIHRLLASALILGLGVTTITYYLWNYTIPELWGRAESVLDRRDLSSIIVGEFQRNKALTFKNYRIYAEGFEALDGERLPIGALPRHSYLRLTGVALMEMDADQVTRFGTSQETIIDFDRSERLPRVTVELRDVRTFDVARKHHYDFDRQVLGPLEFPMPLKRKIKFENLPSLRSFLTDLTLIPEVSDLLYRMKRGMIEQYLYEDVVSHLGEGGDGVYHLVRASGTTYEIRSVRYRQSPTDNQPMLQTVSIVEHLPNGTQRQIEAGQAIFEVRNTADREQPDIYVGLSAGVRMRRSNDPPDSRVVQVETETLGPMPYMLQPQLKKRADAFDPYLALDPSFRYEGLPRKMNEDRGKLIERALQYRSEVVGEIHFRASYSLSAVAVVLIGAMLGIVMRGSQVLTAFGISCVPTAFVVVSGIVGRHQADKPGGETIAIAVMWGSTILTYAAAVYIGTKVLRR